MDSISLIFGWAIGCPGGKGRDMNAVLVPYLLRLVGMGLELSGPGPGPDGHVARIVCLLNHVCPKGWVFYSSPKRAVACVRSAGLPSSDGMLHPPRPTVRTL